MAQKSNLVKVGVPIFFVTWAIFYGLLAWYLVTEIKIVLDLLITVSFFAYHMSIRPLMGKIVGAFRPTFKPKMKRFKVSPYEVYFFEKLKIKNWKDKLPAWNKNNFTLSIGDIKDIEKVTMVIRYNISAEITHLVNFIISVLCTLVALVPGYEKYWWVILVCSIVVSICADLPFIMIQRYNRARLFQVYAKLEKKALKEEINKEENKNV